MVFNWRLISVHYIYRHFYPITISSKSKRWRFAVLWIDVELFSETTHKTRCPTACRCRFYERKRTSCRSVSSVKKTSSVFCHWFQTSFFQDQLIASTLNNSQKVDNLLLLDNRYLKQLDNATNGILTTVKRENFPSKTKWKCFHFHSGRIGFGRKLAVGSVDQSRKSSGSFVRFSFAQRKLFSNDFQCFRQRIDIDFERTDVKSRFNWVNRAAIHYLNKTAFWNLAQYK